MSNIDELVRLFSKYDVNDIEKVLKIIKTKKLLNERPSKESNYYYIKVDGGVSRTIWKGGKSDEGRYILGNCFPTEKEAELELEKRKVNNELKRLAKYFNDPEKLSYGYIMKNGAYTLYLDVEGCDDNNLDATLKVMKKNFTQIGFNTYIEMGLALFTDKESAEKAIEIIGPQRIGDYLFNLKGE